MTALSIWITFVALVRPARLRPSWLSPACGDCSSFSTWPLSMRNDARRVFASDFFKFSFIDSHFWGAASVEGEALIPTPGRSWLPAPTCSISRSSGVRRTRFRSCSSTCFCAVPIAPETAAAGSASGDGMASASASAGDVCFLPSVPGGKMGGRLVGSEGFRMRTRDEPVNFSPSVNIKPGLSATTLFPTSGAYREICGSVLSFGRKSSGGGMAEPNRFDRAPTALPPLISTGSGAKTAETTLDLTWPTSENGAIIVMSRSSRAEK